MSDKDTAHIRFTLDVVLEANGEDHEYLAQRMNSAFGRAIGDGAITGESAAETDVVDARTVLLTPQAAGLDEDQVATWICELIESGSMRLEDLPRLMARYALSDPAEMREEFAERMGLLDEGQAEGGESQAVFDR